MAQGTSEGTSQQVANTGGGGLFGGIINTAGSLISGFNYKGQENDLEMARLQAEQEKSRSESSILSEKNKKYLYIGGAVVALIVLVMLFKRK